MGFIKWFFKEWAYRLIILIGAAIGALIYWVLVNVVGLYLPNYVLWILILTGMMLFYLPFRKFFLNKRI
ncbi:MAG: hypothetical protein FWF57_00540 [Defluviitaleaceae bacterium]|nr:hypothetical protein [Defluviitaleaceae bacterium]